MYLSTNHAQLQQSRHQLPGKVGRRSFSTDKTAYDRRRSSRPAVRRQKSLRTTLSWRQHACRRQRSLLLRNKNSQCHSLPAPFAVSGTMIRLFSDQFHRLRRLPATPTTGTTNSTVEHTAASDSLYSTKFVRRTFSALWSNYYLPLGLEVLGTPLFAIVRVLQANVTQDIIFIATSPLPPLGHIWDVMLVWRKGNIKNYLYTSMSSFDRLVSCIRL